MTLEEAQRYLEGGPYHRWLGVRVLALGEDSIEVRATWREEWMASAERRHTHGGILGALIDLACDNALLGPLGRAVPTIDMRVDYHRAAMPGDLVAKGRVLKLGSQFSTCEAQVYDTDGRLIASGRGTYYTGEIRK